MVSGSVPETVCMTLIPEQMLCRQGAPLWYTLWQANCCLFKLLPMPYRISRPLLISEAVHLSRAHNGPGLRPSAASRGRRAQRSANRPWIIQTHPVPWKEPQSVSAYPGPAERQKPAFVPVGAVDEEEAGDHHEDPHH